ncbi:MAG: crosslink repair DNA glycosylase YcaQ family protein [Chloroflexota bacterium]|nr:crosslink repair DNA glycosylase YcaQ family protein [Chloroflexota bacterium]
MHLTPEHVRHALIAAQGLSARPEQPTRQHVLDIIRQMGVLQIDTINVVARSPYLVLWSRLGAYQPAWLDDLLAQNEIFEYWSHAASFLPIEDYPLYRRFMLDRVHTWARAHTWTETHPEIVNRVLGRIREQGEVRASDFERSDGQKGSWWNWKDEKVALEALHTSGDLMIARRHNFQRIYALRERILPDWDDAEAPTMDEAVRVLIMKSVRALGIAPKAWIADYFRLSQDRVKMVDKLADAGLLVRAQVEGWVQPAFIHPDNLALVDDVAAGRVRHTDAVLLSPFDPIVWDRKRALALFGFDYKIECYTPAPKRRYGYFTLPILWCGALIGRLDAKAHRADGIFEIKALHFEPGVALTDALVSDVADAIRRCAAWHNTPTARVALSDPADAAARFNAALA